MQTDYENAKREGDRAYRRAVREGNYPYLPALNAMVPDIDRYAEKKLGVKEIPLEMIAGTRTVGRQNAFACNFMPLIDWGTEFSSKWAALCDSASEDGIREPIKVYEFMNKFYVEEGNKRVSVSKHIGYYSIPGDVIRILPPKTDDPSSRIYYEYIDFYNVTGIFGITFSREKSYKKLAEYFGCDLTDVWPEQTVETLRAAFNEFTKYYKSKGGDKLPITTGDAFLIYLGVFDCGSLLEDSGNAITNKIQRIWKEFVPITKKDAIELVRNPEEVEKSDRLLSILKKNSAFAGRQVRAAFLFESNEEDSSWIYGHELGANELVEKFGGSVDAIKFENCSEEEDLARAFAACDADKDDIVFATSPAMMKACLKAAIEYPKLRIMNCSVNLSSNSVPTYYPRMYEAYFLNGCLAASLSENHRIGFRADYPIFGGIANINAFAAGAAWFDPYARVKLVWASKKGSDWEKELLDDGCSIISGIDMIKPRDPGRKYGLYRIREAGTLRADGTVAEEQEVDNLAAPVYRWGIYYEQLIHKLIEGALDARKAHADGKAVNYWWGMYAGVVDVILSKNLPYASQKAVLTLRRLITNGVIHPFEGEIHTQSGILQGPDAPPLTDKEIITMDWLWDNVDGEIPDTWELVDSIKKTVKVSGVKE